MIAAALRTEIDLFCRCVIERCEGETLARCALAAQRLTLGMRADAAEETLPSMRALADLVDHSLSCQPAAFLAYRALSEQLLAHARPSAGSGKAREDAFDAIDDLVDDPMELPALRNTLLAFSEHFQRLCQEATRAPRRRVGVSATAA